MHIQKIILNKRKSYFELARNRNKPKEISKPLKFLSLSSDKANKSKTSFKKNGENQFESLKNQFESLKNANLFKSCYTELAADLKKISQGT